MIGGVSNRRKVGGSGVAPGNVKNISILEGQEKITVFWDDPEDIVYEGETYVHGKELN